MKIKRMHKWVVIGLILVINLNQPTSILASINETISIDKNVEKHIIASSSNAIGENNSNKKNNANKQKAEHKSTGSNADIIFKRSNNLSVDVENINEGGLELAVIEALEDNNADKENVTKLKISGTLNDNDFEYIRFNFPELVQLDLENITNTKIPDNALKNSDSTGDVQNGKLFNLKEVILPASVNEIGHSAFSYCRGIEELELSKAVRSLK